MNKHKNIPIFVPHEGCPNDCVFCNQRKISGKTEFDPRKVPLEIQRALETIPPGSEAEIAFFGGSFTGIQPELMVWLLKEASKYVESGQVNSIRLSTRPDMIDEKILQTLQKYHVKHIEIGFQSFDDKVLAASRRGHNAESSYQAAKLIKSYGFELVGQMMTGLPMSDIQKEIFTAAEICRLGASAARIYPTVVFCDTSLCDMQKNGSYNPLTLQQSVDSAYEAYKVFLANGVDVIRCGLCSSDNLMDQETVFSGGYHPALGEMVESRIFYDRIVDNLDTGPGDSIEIFVSRGMTSRAAGHNRQNKIKLFEKYGIKHIKITETDRLKGFELEIKRKD